MKKGYKDNIEKLTLEKEREKSLSMIPNTLSVPVGATHNVINVSQTEPLKLYTIYAPPRHKDGIVRTTREEAIADGPEFDGATTEIEKFVQDKKQIICLF